MTHAQIIAPRSENKARFNPVREISQQLDLRFSSSPHIGSLTDANASGKSSFSTLSSDALLTGLSPQKVHDLRIELVRKSIHLLIALVPAVASLVGVASTLLLLSAGTLLYTVAESVRLQGRSVAFISYVTSIAARPRDAGRFVLGPVTLGLGAMIALLLYPEPAATLAIYSLAFGDGLSSFVGKLVGSARIPFTGGKTVAGSLACFSGVFITAYVATGRATVSVTVATAATVLEAAPTGDLDNLVLPVGVGLIANRLLGG